MMTGSLFVKANRLPFSVQENYDTMKQEKRGKSLNIAIVYGIGRDDNI